MPELKSEKRGKNFYIPAWVIDLIDAELTKKNGPGVITASAVFAFSKLPKLKKLDAINQFHRKQTELEYAEQAVADEAAAAESADAAQKRKRKERASKVV